MNVLQIVLGEYSGCLEGEKRWNHQSGAAWSGESVLALAGGLELDEI